MKTQMQTLSKSNNISFIIKILNNKHFLFTNNRDKIKMSKKEFFELRWMVYNFFYNKIIVIKAQIYSQNFKIPSQLYIVYNYFFCFQKIYTFFLTFILNLIK